MAALWYNMHRYSVIRTATGVLQNVGTGGCQNMFHVFIQTLCLESAASSLRSLLVRVPDDPIFTGLVA